MIYTYKEASGKIGFKENLTKNVNSLIASVIFNMFQWDLMEVFKPK